MSVSRTQGGEIVADGLPLFMGAWLAVETTIVSVLKRDGSARTRCVNVDGASLEAARRRKKPRTPNLLDAKGGPGLSSSVARLVGVGLERLRSSSAVWPHQKARSEPVHLSTTARQAWRLRWAVMLACSAAKAVALSLLESPGGLGSDGATPTTSEVIEEGGVHVKCRLRVHRVC